MYQSAPIRLLLLPSSRRFEHNGNSHCELFVPPLDGLIFFQATYEVAHGTQLKEWDYELADLFEESGTTQEVERNLSIFSFFPHFVRNQDSPMIWLRRGEKRGVEQEH